MFDFRLKVFYVVAKYLSFTKASQELLISQPAITKHIKEIETKLAIRIFERKGNRISLTPAGKILFEKAKISLSDLNVLMHLGSTESIKTYLHHSDAMGIISCAAIKKEVEAGILKTIKIRGIKFKRNFRFVYNQGGPRGLASKFMAFAKRHYNYKL